MASRFKTCWAASWRGLLNGVIIGTLLLNQWELYYILLVVAAIDVFFN
jgi:hypothetical protein